MASPDRWPHWVYGSGTEPDYRFSLANERTFLAWIRTALALIAGGVALGTVRISLPFLVHQGLAALLVALGLLCAAVSWVRWAQAERAMRHAQPLPGSRLGVVLATVVGGAAAVFLIVGLVTL